jgi:hypothetical protein
LRWALLLQVGKDLELWLKLCLQHQHLFIQLSLVALGHERHGAQLKN